MLHRRVPKHQHTCASATVKILVMLLGLTASGLNAERSYAQSQLAQFTNVNYSIYPQPGLFAVPLIRPGNIRLGAVRLHPHMGVAQSYTDNVFRTDPSFGGRTSDWYTSLSPGGQAQLRLLGRHLMVLDYRSNIERYVKNTSQDIEDQTLTGNLVLNFPGGLSVKGIGELKTGHDYRGTATANTATQSDEPNRFYAPNAGIELEYARTLYVRASYRYLDWQFIGPQAGPSNTTGPGDISTRNRIENYYSIAAGGRLASKTYVYLDGLFSTHTYQFNKDLDSRTYTVGVGIKWEVTGKTVGSFALGYQEKDFSNTSLTRGSGNATQLAFNGNVYWNIQERTQLNLGLFRSANETVVGGTRFFVRSGFSLDLTHAFTPKWRATGRFAWNTDDYGPDPISAENKTETRDDYYLTAGAGVSYQVQPWLGTKATYTYGERLSNFISVQYVASVFMLSIQAQF